MQNYDRPIVSQIKNADGIFRKSLLLLLLSTCLFTLVSLGQTKATDKKQFDPTGTYKLDRKTTKENGYEGEIKVKLIDTNKIAISFYITKGAPSYNSGSFVDTLSYSENIAVYKDKDSKKVCTLIFLFEKKYIKIHERANYEFGTCWGAGVVAFGTFKKSSSKTPVIKDPLVED